MKCDDCVIAKYAMKCPGETAPTLCGRIQTPGDKYHGHITQLAEGKKMPSLLTQAGNFAKAILEHALAGFPMVSQEIYKERLAACGSCSFFEAVEARCFKCGCSMKEKAWMAEQQCPLEGAEKRWGAVDGVIPPQPPPVRCCGR